MDQYLQNTDADFLDRTTVADYFLRHEPDEEDEEEEENEEEEEEEEENDDDDENEHGDEGYSE